MLILQKVCSKYKTQHGSTLGKVPIYMLKIGQKEEGETRPIKTLHDAVPYCTPNVTCQVKFQFNIHI